MVYCLVCGRWQLATQWKAHQDEHDLQMLLDHTGPHGSCNRTKASPSCKCPDPVLASGAYVCTCCDGVVATQEAVDY